VRSRIGPQKHWFFRKSFATIRINIDTGEVIMADDVFPHLQTLLVCTDGSPASEGAFNAAMRLGTLTAARICLLGVINSPAVYGNIPAIPELLSALEEQALQRLHAYQEQAVRAGVTLETAVATGISVAEAILDEARARKPDWIVMGRKGLTGLDRLLMGSVTKQVIGLSPCPVLVVPRQARLSVARDRSRQTDCQITLQHLEASAERHGIRLQSLCLEGRPFDQIIQAALEEKVDLLVLGSHGRSGLARLLMGSVAERVTATVNCPVLVVKLPEEATA
jgi:nucleotide-binding universal stress UspA family protein